MNFSKKLRLTLFALALTTIGFLWFLTQTLKPEQIKRYLSVELSKLTHSDATIEGDIYWQLLPRPGMRVAKIHIGEVNNPTKNFVNIESLTFNLKITPLLRGKLVFSELVIDDFNVHLISEHTESSNEKKTAEIDSKSNLNEQFAIERLLLSRGQVSIHKDNQTIALTGLQIGTEQFNLEHQAFPVQFKAVVNLTNNQEKVARTRIDFKGSTSLSPLLLRNPIVALQNITIDGQLALQNLRFKQFKITKIDAHVSGKPGVIQLNPLSLNLYEGQSVGDLDYEFVSGKLQLNQTATNLNTEKLFDDLMHKSIVKGAADFSIHAQVNLLKPDWQESSQGNGSLTIKDGVLESVNLDKLINDTCAKLSQLLSAKETNLKQALDMAPFQDQSLFKGNTNFKLLTFQYHLQNANLETSALILQTEQLQLKGESQINLRDQGIRGQVTIQVNSTNSHTNKIQQRLGGSIPLVLSGNLIEPIILPDLQKIYPLVAKLWLKDNLKKPIKQLNETLDLLLH